MGASLNMPPILVQVYWLNEVRLLPPRSDDRKLSLKEQRQRQRPKTKKMKALSG